MTTVGYGDKYPKTVFGKIFAILVMWIGIAVVFPYFIAAMGNAFSTEIENSNIKNVSDLHNKKVATQEGTTTEDFLSKIGSNTITENSIDNCFKSLEQNKVEAVVYDMPAIKYYLQSGGNRNYMIVGDMFDKQSYGYALKRNSNIRKKLNEVLLDVMKTDDYKVLQTKWFGK